VIPISRGGLNVWTNVVTACSSCNTRKANHLLSRVRDASAARAVEPHFVHLAWAVRRLTPTQARYIKLFYGGDVVRELRARRNGGRLPPTHSAHPA
jgi:hypothetical protein